MKKLELIQMEQLQGGAVDPCSWGGWAVFTGISVLASTAIGVATGGLGGAATGVALSAAYKSKCG